MRLLVVEDDPDLNRQLTTALTDAGAAKTNLNAAIGRVRGCRFESGLFPDVLKGYEEDLRDLHTELAEALGKPGAVAIDDPTRQNLGAGDDDPRPYRVRAHGPWISSRAA